ncbi:MAG TPA: VWA domain-containing protein [Blastocatellia bacterium]|nr:VWA domain-containing protein [Blastocatellia bacterium]
MRVKRLGVLLALTAAIALPSSAVSARMSKPSGQQDQQQSKEKQGSDDEIKLNSTLVQVPAIVTDHDGKFIDDLSKDNFKIYEDGKAQPIGTFATVQQPFNVVLVLDTSNTAEDRLKAIQDTAVSFIQQMTPEDRAMVVTFDDDVRELTEFTSDKSELEEAIRKTESGFGKLLYDAVNHSLEQLKSVEGRRAVVLFSDGVDLGSIDATDKSTEQLADEVGAVIYCVKFNTRWWVDSEARRQWKDHPYPTSGPMPTDGRVPMPPPGATPPIQVESQGGVSVTVSDPNAPQDITKTLDKLYGTADAYAAALSSTSGGKVFEARSLGDTKAAFAEIAKELRNQYVIGYYPSSQHMDGKYHKIKLQVDRKGLQVRARQGYRANTDS